MCLTLNENITINFKADEDCTCYKVLAVNSQNNFVSPFFSQSWNEGWNYGKVLRVLSAFGHKQNKHDEGIHVFLDPAEAKEWADNEDFTTKIVQVHCDKNDLIAVGTFRHRNKEYKSATFSKVFVLKDSFNEK